MNSINLSRFHKFSRSNFKKKIIRNEILAQIVSAQLAEVDPENNQKIKIKKIKKILL